MSLRILHVIDGIGVGGADLVLVRLIEGLQAAGHTNTILSLVTPRNYVDRLTAAGAKIEGMGFASGKLPTSGLSQLRSVFKECQPDIVQGWMYHGNMAATFSRWMAGCEAPLLWSIHNTLDPWPSYRWFTQLALRFGSVFSGRTAGVVYVSAASAPQHERLGFRHDRRIVIPNGTDCDHFRLRPEAGDRLRAELGIETDRKLVGLFARWDPMKGHDQLFAATRRLLNANKQVHLVLAGTSIDPQNSALVDACRQHGLDAHVSLLGERHDIENLVAGLDVFALPSIWGEAFPLVLGEAMAAGTPCVATDVGDSSLIIGDAGSVVPPADDQALADALSRLLIMSAEERRQIGSRARSRIVDMFSLARMVQRYQDLYGEVAAGAEYHPAIELARSS